MIPCGRDVLGEEASADAVSRAVAQRGEKVRRVVEETSPQKGRDDPTVTQELWSELQKTKGQLRTLDKALALSRSERDAYRKELAKMAMRDRSTRSEIEMLRRELSLMPQTAASVRDNAVGKRQILLDDFKAELLSANSQLRRDCARLEEELLEQRVQSKAIFLGDALPEGFIEWRKSSLASPTPVAAGRGTQDSPGSVLELGGVLELPGSSIKPPASFLPAGPGLSFAREKEIWRAMGRGAHKQSCKDQGRSPEPWVGEGASPGFRPASPWLSYSEERGIWHTMLSKSRATSPVSKRRCSLTQEEEIQPKALDDVDQEQLASALRRGLAQ